MIANVIGLFILGKYIKVECLASVGLHNWTINGGSKRKDIIIQGLVYNYRLK